MAKPSLEAIEVHDKRDLPEPRRGKEWDVSFVCVTSRGTRFPERKYFGPSTAGGDGLTKAQLWEAMRTIALGHEELENRVEVKQPPEFEGRLDATSSTPTPLAEVDYPAAEKMS